MSLDLQIKIAADVAGAKAAMEQVSSSLGKVEQATRSTAGSVAQMGTTFRTATAAAAGLLVGLPALQGMTQQAFAATDAMITMQNRLALATGSASQAARAFDQLFVVAQNSRTSFTELGSVYASMARAGVQNIAVVQAIGNAMAISGGSAQGMQAALVQLSQGMAAGVLRGEELNSIMEQAPRLAQALADGLGVPIGSLRKLGEAGELTSQRVVEALMNSAPRLADEMAKSQTTVSQAFTVLGNATTRFMGDADQATGASKAFAGGLTSLAEAITALGNVVRQNETAFAVLAGGVAGVAVVGGVLALKGAMMALIPVVAAVAAALGPVALIIAGAAAAIGAAAVAWNRWKQSDGGIDAELFKLRGRPSIYDTPEMRNPALRAARVRELEAQLALRTGEGLDTSAEDARFRRSTEAFNERERQAARLLQIQRELSGEDEKYTKRISELAAMLQAGTISYRVYTQMAEQAWQATAKGKEATRAMKDAVRDEQRARQQAHEAAIKRQQFDIDRYEQAEREADARVKAGEEIVASIQRETAMLGLSNDERELALALLELERRGLEKGSAAYDEYADRVRRAVGERSRRRAEVQAAQETALEWKRTIESVEAGLTDALMRAFESGKGFAQAFRDTLLNSFRTLVLQPMIRALVAQVGGAMQWAMGMIGTRAALAYANASGTGMDGLMAATGAFGTAGGAAGLGSMAAKAVPYVGWAYAALSRGSYEYEKGWSNESGRRGKDEIFGGDAIGRTFKDLSVDNILTSLGKRLGMNDKWASILSGATAIAQLIGRKAPEVRASGITGAFSGGGFQGMQFADWFSKGGWFRSDKSGTNYDSLGRPMAEALGGGAKQLFDQARGFAEVLGLSPSALSGVRMESRIEFGSDPEANAKAIRDAIADYGQALADAFSTQLEPVRTMGETSADTFARLATSLKAANDMLGPLGMRLFDASVAGASAAAQLAEFAGGLENLQRQTMGYVQDYYSRDEIAGLKSRELQGVLQSLGITQDVNSRDQFRALVEGTDTSTEEGRRRLATLLGISSDFAGVADYLGETGLSLSGAAAQAPMATTLASLGPLLQNSGAAQVQATQDVQASIDDMHETVRQLLEQIAANSAGRGIGWNSEVVQSGTNVT